MTISKLVLTLALVACFSPVAFASAQFVSEGVGMTYQFANNSARGTAAYFARSHADRNCGGYRSSRQVSDWTFAKVDGKWVKASALFECQ